MPSASMTSSPANEPISLTYACPIGRIESPVTKPRFDAGVTPFGITELSTTVLPRLVDDVSPVGLTESPAIEPRLMAYVTALS